jgi:hypothetical protein
MAVRAALFSYFDADNAARLVHAIADAGMPAGVRVHVGTYGVNADTSDHVLTLDGGRYSPMFKATRTDVWDERRLPPRDEAKVGTALRGSVPPTPRLFALSARQRVAWGVEIGRRYRDAIRLARREGIRIHQWQFDELRRELVRSRPERELVRGILQGLTHGRRQLGDRETKGFVYSTRDALRLAAGPSTGDLPAFWLQLNNACFRIVGEEYPQFRGDPRQAARRFADGQRALASGGPARRALAGRYVAALTPGYLFGVGLGGNTAGLSRAAVNRWRDAYVSERARLGLAGFGQFALVRENARDTVLRDVARAVARGMAL